MIYKYKKKIYIYIDELHKFSCTTRKFANYNLLSINTMYLGISRWPTVDVDISITRLDQVVRQKKKTYFVTIGLRADRARERKKLFPKKKKKKNSGFDREDP